MPFWAEMVGVPRTLAVEFPFGHILGAPGNISQQFVVIGEALKVLEEADAPGTIVHSNQKWDEEVDVAMKNWQPEMPSPVIAHMSGKMREILKKSRG